MKSPPSKPKWIPRWKATDFNGETWYFENKPFCDFGVWMPSLGKFAFVGQIKRPSNFLAFASLKPLFLEI